LGEIHFSQKETQFQFVFSGGTGGFLCGAFKISNSD
jgi:hypothetical protein